MTWLCYTENRIIMRGFMTKLQCNAKSSCLQIKYSPQIQLCQIQRFTIVGHKQSHQKVSPSRT